LVARPHLARRGGEEQRTGGPHGGLGPDRVVGTQDGPLAVPTAPLLCGGRGRGARTVACWHPCSLPCGCGGRHPSRGAYRIAPGRRHRRGHDGWMATLADLADLDLTTVELVDGTPLLAAWAPRPDGTG